MPKRTYRDIHHGALITLLHNYKAWTRSQETGKFSQTEPGSADIMAQLRYGACAIEVKTAFGGTFRLPEWRENQREWAIRYQLELNNTYWLAIFFETDECPWKGLRNPRVPYLIPANAVLNTISLIPQDSIPYRAGKGISIFMQEHKLDAFSLWSEYSLGYNKGWILPDEHPFTKQYIQGEPLGQSK